MSSPAASHLALWSDAAPSAPPPAPESEELRFWVGEWALTWEGGSGRNVVRELFGGRAFLESFSADAPEELRGHSISAWDAPRRRWAQTWWDNTGAILQLRGGFRDGVLELATDPQPDGTVHRMRFTDIGPTAFGWEWARRGPGATGFEPLWRIQYARVEDACRRRT